MSDVRVLHGDCVELLAGLEDCSVDSIVTDPPYELGFMGKQWDGAGIAYSVELWSQCLRVLKPGGHLLAFGGTRTYHRMACAIEDAGFEIRDSIHWVYGSGFPKSLNVGKAIDKTNGEGDRRYKFTGWMRTTGLTARQLDEVTGTNMGGHYLTAKSQPAIPTAELWAVIRPLCGEVPEWVDELVARVEAEREVVGRSDDLYGRKSGIANGTKGHTTVGGTVAEAYDVTAPATDEAKRWEGWGTSLKPAHEPVVLARKPLAGTVAGNVLEFGTGGLNIDGCRVATTDRFGGGANGTSGFAEGYESGDGWQPGSPSGRWPANVVFDGAAAAALDQQSGDRPGAVSVSRGRTGTFDFGSHDKVAGYGDNGGASRFFTQSDFGPDDWPFVYQAKPSKRERNAGLDGLEAGQPVGGADKWTETDRRKGEGVTRTPSANVHPTVKPVALMRHLVRLVTPPGGTVLDPFAGSGTTLVAAVLEGMNAIGCEMTDEYLPIIRGRVAWAEEQADAQQPTLM